MSDLDDLYQELILDHNKRPRNQGRLEAANRSADGYNPLCGDHVTVHLNVQDDVVHDLRFEGSGCAISTASASIMTESLKGKTIDQAKALFRTFHDLVTRPPDAAAAAVGTLGKLAAFSGVCQYPARVKCATLAWHTLGAALEQREDVISTE